MAGCIRELHDKSKCGLETQRSKDYCYIHRKNAVLPHADKDIIKRYLNDSKHKFYDLSDLNFDHISFDKDFFPKNLPIFFDNSRFQNCSFNGLSSNSDFSAIECQFKETNFQDFHLTCKKINFSKSKFLNNDMVFQLCTFIGEDTVDFSGVEFHVEVFPFHGCYISTKKLDFSDSFFSSDRLFIKIYNIESKTYDHRYLSIKSDEIYFDRLRFEGHFECTAQEDDNHKANIIRFSLINFSQMKTSTIINVNLEKTRFTYSVLDKINFINVKWPDSYIIYDESCPVDSSSQENIKESYLSLKRNYEKKMDYLKAGQWFYREMEIRRKQVSVNSSENCKWIRQNVFSFYPWYKYTSKYGESYIRPLIWLGFIMSVFGLVYYFLRNEFEVTPHISSFFDGLKYSFATMTFSYRWIYENISQGFHFISIIQIILTTIFMSLFLFALRRKFRR